MSLLAEYIPKHNRAGFAGEIVDLKLFSAFDHLRIVCARLAQPCQIAFNVGHENRHAPRTKIFGEGLKSDCLSGSRSAGNQAVAVCHFRQQKDWLLGLGDSDGLSHDLVTILPMASQLSSAASTKIERAIATLTGRRRESLRLLSNYSPLISGRGKACSRTALRG